MKDYLKVYKANLHTLSPVFVGNGKEISKKEYCIDYRNSKIIVYDPGKLYGIIRSLGKHTRFESFLLNNNDSDLNRWLLENNIDRSRLEPAIRYSMDSGDRLQMDKTRVQVMEFAKDPYGKPYVPGSGIKGLLRTILLCSEIVNNRKRYSELSDKIRKDEFRNRRSLAKESRDVEVAAFNTLERNDGKKLIDKNNAVNDVLQKIVISDSRPLETSDLVLCQKIDKHSDGSERSLPILRECLKPGTDIEFTITIDTENCKYDDGVIMEAVKTFTEIYQADFLRKYRFDTIDADTVFLGGGVGFVSKTFIYPMFRGDEGVKMATNVFKAAGTQKNNNDTRLGVSPHVLKCTHYEGKTYQMGKCRISLERIN